MVYSVRKKLSKTNVFQCMIGTTVADTQTFTTSASGHNVNVKLLMGGKYYVYKFYHLGLVW